MRSCEILLFKRNKEHTLCFPICLWFLFTVLNVSNLHVWSETIETVTALLVFNEVKMWRTDVGYHQLCDNKTVGHCECEQAFREHKMSKWEIGEINWVEVKWYFCALTTTALFTYRKMTLALSFVVTVVFVVVAFAADITNVRRTLAISVTAAAFLTSRKWMFAVIAVFVIYYYYYFLLIFLVFFSFVWSIE